MNSLNQLPTVLVVDDKEADQFLCEHAIEQYNQRIQVVKAFNGREALDTLAAMPASPDLIFLDINMPYMNGVEFLEHYHHLERAEPNIVLMLTLSIDSNEAQKAKAYSQVKKVVSKPLTPAIIEECFAVLK